MEDPKKKLSVKPRARALVAIAGSVVLLSVGCEDPIGDPPARPDATLIDATSDSQDPVGLVAEDASADAQPDMEPVGLPAPDAG